MSLSEVLPARGVRHCSRCGSKLSVSNPEKTCRSLQACEGRAAKNTVVKAHTPPLRYKQIERVSAPQFNNKLTFEHVLDALCDHFMYSSSQRAALLNSKSYREYRHAKYMLVHLLLVDLKVTQEEASELVQCARRTISTVCQHVRSNKLQFEHDLKRIRELYPKETKNDS